MHCDSCGAPRLPHETTCIYCGVANSTAFAARRPNPPPPPPHQPSTQHRVVPTQTIHAPPSLAQIQQFKRMITGIVVTIFIVIALSVGIPVACTQCNNNDGFVQLPPGQDSNRPPPSLAIVGPGQHRVGIGQAIEPGEYLLIMHAGRSMGSMTVTLSPGASTSSPDFVFIRNFNNRAFVRLEEGQWINISWSDLYRIEDVPPINKYADPWPVGEYLVGQDLHPGLYRLTMESGRSMGSVTIRTIPNARSGQAGFVSINNFQGQRYVDLIEGQYIDFSWSTLTRVLD